MTVPGDSSPRGGPRHRLAALGMPVLGTSLLLGCLHALVALPHFVVRVWRGAPSEALSEVANSAQVTDRLWRGAAPTAEGYRALTEVGIGHVIDVRAEADVSATAELATAAGMSSTHVPIRDGQTPSSCQLSEIAGTIDNSDRPVFVHCQAGVGRTGSVIAALRVANGESPGSALVEALRVGPLSLEQQSFVLRSHRSNPSLPPIVVASRVIDSPRRLLSRLKG